MTVAEAREIIEGLIANPDDYKVLQRARKWLDTVRGSSESALVAATALRNCWTCAYSNRSTTTCALVYAPHVGPTALAAVERWISGTGVRAEYQEVNGIVVLPITCPPTASNCPGYVLSAEHG